MAGVIVTAGLFGGNGAYKTLGLTLCRTDGPSGELAY